MMTVVDPAGTPAPVYNRSGTTIVTIDGGPTTGSTAGSAVGDDGTPIPRFSQMTIVLVNTPAYDGHHHIVVRLPSDADIGDIVEVYRAPGASESPLVFPNVGETIGSNAASTGTNTGVGVSAASSLFRKVSSAQWMPLLGG